MNKHLLWHFIRLQTLQMECFRRNKHRWARSLGEELKALIADNPELKKY